MHTDRQTDVQTYRHTGIHTVHIVHINKYIYIHTHHHTYTYTHVIHTHAYANKYIHSLTCAYIHGSILLRTLVNRVREPPTDLALQDTALVFGLEDAKFTSDEVKEKVKIAQETEAKINTISQNYCILFACWLELGTFHCQKSVPIMLQSAFHIFPARVDSYRPKNDIEVFRKLWACARFLSTSFANNLLFWFGSWTSHAKTLLRQFPMPLRPLPKLPGPVASRGSLLFFLMMELSKMHTFYKQPGTCFTEANCFFSQYAC